MLVQPTIQKLKNLKLFGMAEAFQSLIDTPDSQALSFDERVGLIVDRESTHRDNRRQTRLLKHAKLRSSQACIEDINYQHARGLERSQMQSFIICDWIRRQQNIIFLGPTGVGKTYLACALGQQACRNGFSVGYYRLTRLFEMVRIAQDEGKYTQFMGQLSKTDVIIIDDWGLGQLKKNERQDLLEILEDRQGLKSTVITSQLPIQLWHEYIGDATIADAILDRLLCNAHKMELRGTSLRSKEPDKVLEVDSKRSPEFK